MEIQLPMHVIGRSSGNAPGNLVLHKMTFTSRSYSDDNSGKKQSYVNFRIAYGLIPDFTFEKEDVVRLHTWLGEWLKEHP